jgi:hypothetical protein
MALESCESCGREFACRPDDPAGCWCTAVVLDPNALAVMREHFERCLCPDCLLVVAQRPRVA